MQDDQETQLNNPEWIAYQLMLDVLAAEGRPLRDTQTDKPKASRNLILDAYADCLEAVLGKRERRSSPRRLSSE